MIFGIASGKPVESPCPIVILVTYCGLCIVWTPTTAIRDHSPVQDVDVFRMTALREILEKQANLCSLIHSAMKGLSENVSR
jgi:hypothetical protein